MILKLRMAWLVVLALLAGPAFALGLGQIEVKSARDQPLLAEIPIISSDPAELEQLQARLASPDTFARIGLEPPRGLVSNLQFMVGLDAQGRPVIRVTSVEPVQQPLLTFLVEVDWGQGRLVREYSALVDAPRTVSAPAQPAIQAPTVQPSNTVRLPDAPVTAVPPVPAPAADAAPVPAPAPAEPGRQAGALAPTPTPAPEPALPPQPVAATGAPPAAYGPIKPGETLGAIAGELALPGYSLDQTMLALLRGNPDAFVDGNLNLVRQGAVLRVPAAGEVASLGAPEAAAMVRDQVARWREAQRPAPQPVAIAGESAAPSTRPAAAGPTPRVADARLEIVPPTANGGRRAGTRSGIEAGGEGEMLRQELQQTKESLAARNSEVDELKARLADLEKLQQQQAQLLSLKDSELAAAQQRLAASNAQAAAPATTAAPATPAAPERDGQAWLWSGIGLVVLALLATWWMRRRPPAPAARGFTTEDLALGMPTATATPAAAVDGVDTRPANPPDAMRQPAFAATVAAPQAPLVPSPPARDLPTFASSQPAPPAAGVGADATAPTWNASAPVMPTWHAGTATVATDFVDGGGQRDVADATPRSPGAEDPMDAHLPESTETPAGLGADPDHQERIELARAYIDLGDVDTARGLLREVAASHDAAASSEASRLLRELA